MKARNVPGLDIILSFSMVFKRFCVEILSLPQILHTLGNLWYSMNTGYRGNDIESKWREADELEQGNGFTRGTIS